MEARKHFREDGTCRCPKIYPCVRCGTFCTDHDLMIDVHLCSDCWKQGVEAVFGRANHT